MSDDDATEEEAKPYGLWGRVILFGFIVGPGSLIAFGLWVRMGTGVSVSSAVERGDWTQTVLFAFWLAGILGTAIAIFKR